MACLARVACASPHPGAELCAAAAEQFMVRVCVQVSVAAPHQAQTEPEGATAPSARLPSARLPPSLTLRAESAAPCATRAGLTDGAPCAPFFFFFFFRSKLSLDKYMYYAALSTSRAFSIYGDHDQTHVRAQARPAAMRPRQGARFLSSCRSCISGAGG